MKKHYLAALAATAAVCATPASAATIVSTLPDYSSPQASAGFPINLGTVGTFTYAIPVGETIIAAFFEGTYGNAAVSSSTASYDASIDGNSFTVCALFSPNCYGGGDPLRPFSIALSSASFASLMDGSADLSLTQTTSAVVRLGSPTLRIETAAAVPEPATWLMMLGGLGAIGFGMRRRRTVRTTVSFA